MHRLTVLALGAAALGTACVYGPQDGTGTTEITSATLATGAGAGADPTPLEIRPELRVAYAVCHREDRCRLVGAGGVYDTMADCVWSIGYRMEAQLDAWDCSPAATRARFEECLPSIAGESCSAILVRSTRDEICAPNVACGL